MKKLFKWLFRVILVLVVLLVAAGFLLPVLFDPNDHKPRIQQMASDTIGREVVLVGPIKWSVFPWVAIDLNDVTVANETGFRGDYLAQIKQVAVEVKLLPLLRKEIQVGEVKLHEPVINLQVAQSGKNNWESLQVQSDSAETSTPSESADIEIRGVSVSNGALNYTDTAAALNLNITEFNFSSDTIKANQPTAMNLVGELDLPSHELSGTLQARWLAHNLTGDTGMLLDINDLSFKGQVKQTPLDLSVDGDSRVNLQTDSLSIEKIQLAYGPMQVSTPVTGANLSGAMSLSGYLLIDDFALDELMTAMGSSLDNQANNQLSGEAKWSYSDDRLKLTDLAWQLDESNISGDVNLSSVSGMQGRFALLVDQLNLDQYLPTETEGNVAAEASTQPLDLGQLQGQVEMQSLQAAGVKFSDITLKIKTQGQNIYLEPLQAGFYQGLIKTELQLEPQKGSEKLRLTHQMSDFQAGGLLTDLMGSEYITGLGQLQADIKIDKPFSQQPLKTANGTVSYRLTDGDIVGVDVFDIIQKSLSFLNQKEAATSNAELKTAFGLMEINAQVKQGVLTTDTLKLTSPYFDLSGKVTIDLDQQTIKGTIKPMLTNIPEGVLDERYTKLLGVRIPVSLKGNLLQPDVSIDIEKLILESQKAKIDEKKEELKEDLFDALLGGKKDKKNNPGNQPPVNEQGAAENDQPEMTEREKRKAKEDRMKRDLLEGLFKSNKDKERDQTEADNQDDDDDNDNGN